MGQTTNTQAFSNISIIQDFQDFLYRNRVYIAENGNLITSNIQAVIISTEELIQIEAKIIHQLQKPKNNLYSLEGNFNSY